MVGALAASRGCAGEQAACPAGSDCQQIAIPADIRRICRDEPLIAEKIQTNVREQFVANIAEGRAAVGFEFNKEQGTYLLERYED